MTDIITRAQELATNGHTPGPWESTIHADYAGYAAGDATVGIMDVRGTYADIAIAAFAPDAVSALAEETWEYRVEYYASPGFKGPGEALPKQWIPHPDYIGEQWRRSLESAKAEMKIMAEPTLGCPSPFPSRIVRRRVSPVEAME